MVYTDSTMSCTWSLREPNTAQVSGKDTPNDESLQGLLVLRLLLELEDVVEESPSREWV